MNKIILILIAAMFTLSCEDCGNGKCNNKDKKKENCNSCKKRHRRW